MIQATLNRAPCDAKGVKLEFLPSRSMRLRRTQDLALKGRLEQLEAARGVNVVAGSDAGSSAKLPEVAPAVVLAAAVRPAFGWGPFLLTALVSGVICAGLTWWVLVGQAAGSTQFVVTAPVAAVPVSNTSTAGSAGLVVLPNVVEAEVGQVPDLVEGWRQAWERRDADAYLAYYSDQFVPSKGQTHDAWRLARHKNLSSRSSISVGVNGLRTDHMGADRVKVTFLQDYASGKYQERAQPKTLMLQRQGTSWKIVGEWQGAQDQ